MLDVCIRLKAGKSLDDVKSEVQTLNGYAQEGTPFPRPVLCEFTPSSEEGFVNVRISNYNYLDWSVLPAQPSTFTIVSGLPETVTVFA